MVDGSNSWVRVGGDYYKNITQTERGLKNWRAHFNCPKGSLVMNLYVIKFKFYNGKRWVTAQAERVASTLSEATRKLEAAYCFPDMQLEIFSAVRYGH